MKMMKRGGPVPADANNSNKSFNIMMLSNDSRQFRWRPSRKKPTFKTTAFFLILFFFFALAVSGRLRWINPSIFLWDKGIPANTKSKCIPYNPTKLAPENYSTGHNFLNSDRSFDATCPPHFRWIHEDLRPWRETGITRDMVERARKTAHFRLVILDGRVYVEKYRKSIQTRDLFTLWGFVQLLRWYPGRLPDLELLFDCDDRPVVRSVDFQGPHAGPPPLFRYCSDEASLDIVFPDWSFWGWAEINIKPWKKVLEDIKEGNKRTKWKDRVPYAYWKGNPNVDPGRRNLLKCNLTDKENWGTVLYNQDWDKESKEGYQQSNLEDQCTHRYKIYIEGWAWSVSEKYIMACDSMTMYVKPRFFDFFIRAMVPLQHYWPIRVDSKCSSLKFAVQWGNNLTNKAEAIGEEGSKYLQENVKMEYVYDYMFHLLNEYSKLLKFRPKIPSRAVELCPETMIDAADGVWKKFMEESLEMSAKDTKPCDLPPPYDPTTLMEIKEKKSNAVKQVELWENEFWETQQTNNNKH